MGQLGVTLEPLPRVFSGGVLRRRWQRQKVAATRTIWDFGPALRRANGSTVVGKPPDAECDRLR